VPARSRLSLAIVLATLSAAAAAPAANAAWTAPQTFAGPGASDVQTAGNRRGSEALVWRVTSKRFVRLPAQTGFAGSVRARVRLPDGTLGKAVTISATNEIVSGSSIGVDEAGNVTAVWAQAGSHIRIMAAFHPHGKPFSKPVELGRSGAFISARPQIAVGRFGDAVIAWNSGPNVVVRRYAGTAQCSAARHFSCFKAALKLRRGADQTVAIGPLGSAYVTWAAQVRTGDDVHTRLRMVVVRRSGLRNTEHFVSRAADGDASQPSIGVRPDGTADIAWRASLPAGSEQNVSSPILVASSSPDAVVTQPVAVSTARGDEPFMRVTRQGEAIVSWDQLNPSPQNPDGEEVAYAVRTAGAAAFGAPTTISAAGLRAADSSLAVDSSGGAYIVYDAAPAIGPAPAGTAGVSHFRPAAGAFGAPVALPANDSGVRVFSAGAKVSVYMATASGLTISDWTP
jgi:hypothetical protein